MNERLTGLASFGTSTSWRVDCKEVAGCHHAGRASFGRGEAKGFVPGLADTVMACHASVAPAARPRTRWSCDGTVGAGGGVRGCHMGWPAVAVFSRP
jgi:hypothetical protein